MLITNDKDLSKVYDFLKKNVYIAYDIESTGLNTRKDEIIGFGISNSEEGFYIVYKHWCTSTQKFVNYVSLDQIKQLLFKLENNHQLVAHNASFDLRFTKNYFGVDLVDNLWSESMLAKHTVDEEHPFKLKDIAENLYGADSKEEQRLMKESIKNNGGSLNEFYKADLELLGNYCIQDCILTYKINEHYLQEIKNQGLTNFFFKEEVMPLYKTVIIPMELNGIPLDVPKMEKAQLEITEDIARVESEIQNLIKPFLGKFEEWFLNKDYPVSRNSANPFVQALAKHLNINLPKTASGKYSLTAKNLKKLEDCAFKRFMLNGEYLDPSLIKEVQLSLFEGEYMFNISSKHHLKKLFFEHFEEQALSHTELGSPQIDEEFLESIATKYDFVPLIITYNKLNKIKATYIDRFLEAQEDGIFYPSWQMHQTTSGRLGGDLMQLPRALEEEVESIVGKYTNQIRSFFIAPKNSKLVGADWASLEVVVFADDAGDETLLEMIKNNEDFYSRVAIDVHDLGDKYSASKTAENFLKKLNPQLRQESKVYGLGIRYNMQAFKLSHELAISEDKARNIIKKYFESYPKLKSRMDELTKFSKENGYIKSKAGRIRHLPLLKKLYYTYGDDLADSLQLWKQYNENPKKYKSMKYLAKQYRGMINNCLNFPIQSMAASICNLCCIEIQKRFKQQGINANICMIIHDEIVVMCEETKSEQVKQIMQDVMENLVPLKVPLSAVPQIGSKYSDVK